MVNETVPNDANALRAKGSELFAAENYDQAAEEYSMIIDENMCTSGLYQRHPLQSRRVLHQTWSFPRGSQRLDPHNIGNPSNTPVSTIARAHYRLAQCHLNLGDYEEAKACMDHYDTSLVSSPNRDNTEMISLSTISALKRSINDKRNDKRYQEQQAHAEMQAETEPVTEGASEISHRRIIYDVKVLPVDGDAFDITYRFEDERAPVSLLTLNPPKKPLRKFLSALVEKHHDTVFNARVHWTCWRCGCLARGMAHKPDAARLHDAERPCVVDVVRPVCGVNEVCEHQVVHAAAAANPSRKEVKAMARALARRMKGRSGLDMDMDMAMLLGGMAFMADVV